MIYRFRKMWHCTKCKQQFKTLASDEDYDFCPLCHNDMFVFEGPLPEGLKPKPPVTKYAKKKEFNIEEWRKRKAEQEAYEDRRLKHYHEVYKREGARSADEAYRNYSEDNFKQ